MVTPPVIPYRTFMQDTGSIKPALPLTLYLGMTPASQDTGSMQIILGWAELHREELLANWQKLLTGELVDKIDGV